jgi:hypothetical protein
MRQRRNEQRLPMHMSLGVDRKGVRNDHGPLSDALNARLSHPAPTTPAPRFRGGRLAGDQGGGRGAGGEGQNRHPNASNTKIRQHVLPALERTRVRRQARIGLI